MSPQPPPTNGKTYVTWAWIVAVLLMGVGFLAKMQLEAIDRRLWEAEARQADIRERLRVVEELLRRHSNIQNGDPHQWNP